MVEKVAVTEVEQEVVEVEEEKGIFIYIYGGKRGRDIYINLCIFMYVYICT
jgi:hypothetical protein